MVSLRRLSRGSDSFLRRHLRAERYGSLNAYLREQSAASAERRGGPSVWSAPIFEKKYKLPDLRPAASVILGPQQNTGPVEKAVSKKPKVSAKGVGAKAVAGVGQMFSNLKKALFTPHIRAYPQYPVLMWEASGSEKLREPSPI